MSNLRPIDDVVRQSQETVSASSRIGQSIGQAALASAFLRQTEGYIREAALLFGKTIPKSSKLEALHKMSRPFALAAAGYGIYSGAVSLSKIIDGSTKDVVGDGLNAAGALLMGVNVALSFLPAQNPYLWGARAILGVSNVALDVAGLVHCYQASGNQFTKEFLLQAFLAVYFNCGAQDRARWKELYSTKSTVPPADVEHCEYAPVNRELDGEELAQLVRDGHYDEYAMSGLALRDPKTFWTYVDAGDVTARAVADRYNLKRTVRFDPNGSPLIAARAEVVQTLAGPEISKPVPLRLQDGLGDTDYNSDQAVRIKRYRYGDEPDQFDEESLKLLYDSLDQPSLSQNNRGLPALDYAHFKEAMAEVITKPFPKGFLDTGFRFTIKGKGHVSYDDIDIVLLRQVTEQLRMIDTLDKVKNWLVETACSPNTHGQIRKKLRPIIIEQFSMPAWSDLTTPSSRETIEIGLHDADVLKIVMDAFYESIREQVLHGNAADVAQTLVLARAYHSFEAVRHRAVIAKYHLSTEDRTNPLPIQVLIETNNALNDLFTDLVPSEPFLIGLREIKQELVAQQKIADRVFEHTVEVIPTKSLTDRFAGYLGEDCSKKLWKELYKNDFQICRIIVDGVRQGTVYVREGNDRSKTAMTFGMNTRMRFKTNPNLLLLGMEKGFAAMAKRRGNRFALISRNEHEQTDRVDMREAIKRREYSPMEFDNGKSEMFAKKNYHVVYDSSRDGMPDSTGITLLQRDAVSGEWLPIAA